MDTPKTVNILIRRLMQAVSTTAESGPHDSPGQICKEIEDSNLSLVLFYRFLQVTFFMFTYFKTEVDLFQSI